MAAQEWCYRMPMKKMYILCSKRKIESYGDLNDLPKNIYELTLSKTKQGKRRKALSEEEIALKRDEQWKNWVGMERITSNMP